MLHDTYFLYSLVVQKYDTYVQLSFHFPISFNCPILLRYSQSVKG